MPPSASVPVQSFNPEPEAVGLLTHGVGFNWFDFFGSGGVYARYAGYPLDARIYPPLDDEASWRLIGQEIARLRPGFVRFGIPPHGILAPDGSLRTDAVHFRRLDRVAEWCRALGAAVMLDPFLIPEPYEFPVPPGAATQAVNMAAADNRAYAEQFVAPLLVHVVAERGLDAVRFFNPVNEPDHYGVYQTPPGGPDVVRHYVEMYAEMRRALDAAGLGRERVGLVGIDKDLPFDFPVLEYHARGIDIDPYVDAYAIHSYRSRFDWAPETPVCPESDPLGTLVDRWVKRLADYAGWRGKELLACEVGAFYYGWREGNPSGPATPEGTILTAETILRMINAGVRGALVWTPMNPNTIDGWWRMFDVRGGRILREPHTYPTYALLMRYAPRGSAVHPLRPTARTYPQHVWGTLFRAPDGHIHLVLINDHPHEERGVDVWLPGVWRDRTWARLRKDRLRWDRTQEFGLAGHDEAGLHLHDILPPMSIQAYTTEREIPWSGTGGQ